MSYPATARPRGQPKPLLPAHVEVGHLAYHPGLGLGTFDLTSADATDTYVLFANRAAGRLVGMRLTKLSSGETHDVDMTAPAWRCNCGDATYRPDRPGGCKHVVALRHAAALLRPPG